MKRCFEGASPSGCGGCRPRGGTGGTPWRAWGPPRGWPTGRGVARMLGGLAGWHPGLDSSIRGLVGRPLWWRRAADEGRRLARGYSFQIKRISPRASQERFPGGFRISPRDPLETTKGEACGPLLWKPLGGWTGGTGAFVPVLRPRVTPRRGRAPSWFPALALERNWIIFCRGVYVAKNTSQAASVKNGRPIGAAILRVRSACSFIRLDGFAVKARKSSFGVTTPNESFIFLP